MSQLLILRFEGHTTFHISNQTVSGKGIFGTFSPLASGALFAAVGHYCIVQCTQRKDQCAVCV